MNQPTKRACEFAENVICSFYEKRDISKILHCFASDATWIGPADDEYSTSGKDVVARFLDNYESVPKCRLVDRAFSVAIENEHSWLVMGRYVIHVTEGNPILGELHQRASVYITEEDGGLKIRHMHFSNPSADVRKGQFFADTQSKQDYEYIQRLLIEKSEVIDMISSNINGGLKGSNDDDTFSYFYVNEGLPRMLGYTYAEFMEMSKGSAVGAVYPPDLDKALADVARCFATGPVYSSEYRIRKKDGSLMWVMDSGRKALNNNGITKINSILTDITPLKNTMSELQVERERYRVALENVTDVIFEYDIQTDIFMTYQRIEVGGKVELETQETPRYSDELKTGSTIYLDDVEEMMAFCRGNLREPIEVRARWQGKRVWLRAQCSVFCNDDRQPIKTIGSLKDITEEKAELLRLTAQTEKDPLTGLLNSSAAKLYTEKLLCSDETGRGALLMIDVDEFKSVNDTYGHLKGDEVLVRFAAVLTGQSFVGDVVARVGGDEFLMFIANVTEDEARLRAKGILADTREIVVAGVTKLSCSVGVAYAADSSYQRLYQLADGALYEAKNNGKNRFVLKTDS